MVVHGLSYGTSWAPFALEVLWKATLLLSAASAAAWLLRGSSAALRHLVWTMGVVAALAVPVAMLVIPSWRVAVLPHTSAGAQFDDLATSRTEVDSSPDAEPITALSATQTP